MRALLPVAFVSSALWWLYTCLVGAPVHGWLAVAVALLFLRCALALIDKDDKVDDATLRRISGAHDAQVQIEDALGSPEPRKRPDETAPAPRADGRFTKEWGDQ